MRLSSSGLPAATASTPARPAKAIGNIVKTLNPKPAYIQAAEIKSKTPPHSARARAIAPPAMANSGAMRAVERTKPTFSTCVAQSPTSP